MLETNNLITEHIETPIPIANTESGDRHTHTSGIKCTERQEEADAAFQRVHQAIQILGFELQPEDVPRIRVVFEDSDSAQNGVNLGRVRIHADGSADIVFDTRLASNASETTFLSQLEVDYPGFSQTLMHEIAHILMTSVTQMPRQPATRLLDEGWASLIEHIAASGNNMSDAASQAGKAMKDGLENEPHNYERCLDLNKAVQQGEDINSAEYVTGRAILHWIFERYGKDSLKKLLQLSPDAVRRNDDRNDDSFDEAMIDQELHGLQCAREYAELLSSIPLLSSDELSEKALDWQGRQQERAFLEVTGLPDIESVKSEFMSWLRQE